MQSDEEILAKKKSWRNAEQRKGDRRLKDGTAAERKDTADVLRAGRIAPIAPENRHVKEGMEESAFMLIACIIIAIILMIVFARPAHSQCQDPNTLSPELKKAYYELKKASRELGGFTVSIKCYK